MPELEIKIWTHDEHLVNELKGFGTKGGSIPGGATISYKRGDKRESLGGELPFFAVLAISFGTGVVASLVANWLVGKLKGRAKVVKIGTRLIDIETEQGARIQITEEIEWVPGKRDHGG